MAFSIETKEIFSFLKGSTIIVGRYPKITAGREVNPWAHLPFEKRSTAVPPIQSISKFNRIDTVSHN